MTRIEDDSVSSLPEPPPPHFRSVGGVDGATTARGGRRTLTLSHALLRGHVICALIAGCFVGACLMAAGGIQLRSLIDNNLLLVTRSIAYTAEAAVVFDDRAATLDAIRAIAATNGVECVRIFDRSGAVLALWQHQVRPSGTLHSLIVRMMQYDPILVPIVSQGVIVGKVELYGNPDGFLSFIDQSVLWILVCILLSVLSTVYLSRRVFRGITASLGEMTRVTHEVRIARGFGQRVPPAAIADLNALANDFNSLLEELERWEAGIQREKASLAYQATHDSLTGLANRELFHSLLNKVIERATAEAHRFAILYLDADRFKEINDTLGHTVGDRVLMTVAARVGKQLRPTDVAARLGGDEFAVLLAPLDDIEDILRIVARITKHIRAPILLDNGITVVPSLSVGIAVFPEDGTDSDTLLQAADMAMYLDKSRLRTLSIIHPLTVSS